jgi:SpoVK/Ycf46/Vps4 family AAA+-type ATPase
MNLFLSKGQGPMEDEMDNVFLLFNKHIYGSLPDNPSGAVTPDVSDDIEYAALEDSAYSLCQLGKKIVHEIKVRHLAKKSIVYFPDGIKETPLLDAALDKLFIRAAAKGSAQAAGIVALKRAIDLKGTGMYKPQAILKASEGAVLAFDRNAMAAQALTLMRLGQSPAHAKALYLLSQGVFEDIWNFGGTDIKPQAVRAVYGRKDPAGSQDDHVNLREEAMNFFFPPTGNKSFDDAIRLNASVIRDVCASRQTEKVKTAFGPVAKYAKTELESDLELFFYPLPRVAKSGMIPCEIECLAFEEALWGAAAMAAAGQSPDLEKARTIAGAALRFSELARKQMTGQEDEILGTFGRARLFNSCLNTCIRLFLFPAALCRLGRRGRGHSIPDAPENIVVPCKHYQRWLRSDINKVHGSIAGAVNDFTRRLGVLCCFNPDTLLENHGRMTDAAAVSMLEEIISPLETIHYGVNISGAMSKDATDDLEELFKAAVKSFDYTDALTGPARGLALELGRRGRAAGHPEPGKVRMRFLGDASTAFSTATLALERKIELGATHQPKDSQIRMRSPEAVRWRTRHILAKESLSSLAFYLLDNKGCDLGTELRLGLMDAAELFLDSNQAPVRSAEVMQTCGMFLLAATAWCRGELSPLVKARLRTLLLSRPELVANLSSWASLPYPFCCMLLEEENMKSALKDASNCLCESMDKRKDGAFHGLLLAASLDGNGQDHAEAELLRDGVRAYSLEAFGHAREPSYADPLVLPGFGGLCDLERAQEALSCGSEAALEASLDALKLSIPEKGFWKSCEAILKKKKRFVMCQAAAGLFSYLAPTEETQKFKSLVESSWNRMILYLDCISYDDSSSESEKKGTSFDLGADGGGKNADVRRKAEIEAGKANAGAEPEVVLPGFRELSETISGSFLKDFRNWCADPRKFRPPHLLISGPSNSGKTWCVGNLLKQLGISTTFDLDASVLGSRVHESGSNINDVFDRAALNSNGRPVAVIMEGIDSTFTNRQMIRKENDWTAEDVQGLVNALERHAEKGDLVLVVATAHDDGRIDPSVLKQMHLRIQLSELDEEDASGLCMGMFGKAPDKRLARLLAGRMAGSVARFCHRVIEEQGENPDTSFDACIGTLNRLDGFTIPEGARFSLPGQSEFTRQVNDTVVRFLASPDAARKFNVQFPSSMILYGETGTGKTYAAQKLAEFLGWKCMNLNAQSFTPSSIASDFRMARESAPCVVVVNEIDSVTQRRDSLLSNVALCEEFLRVLDTARSDRILVIGTTNYIDRIDPAILRKGRFGTHIEIGPLCYQDCLDMVRASFAGIPVEDGFSFEKLSRRLEGRTAAEVSGALEEARAIAAARRAECVTMEISLEALDKADREKRADNRAMHAGSGSRIGFI